MKLPHRIELHPVQGTVRVAAGGRVLADSGAAIELREGRLRPRYYLPQADVRMDLLEPSEHTSRCPWKGRARYWSAGELADVAWAYPEPLEGVAAIRDHVAFYDERVELSVG